MLAQLWVGVGVQGVRDHGEREEGRCDGGFDYSWEWTGDGYGCQGVGGVGDHVGGVGWVCSGWMDGWGFGTALAKGAGAGEEVAVFEFLLPLGVGHGWIDVGDGDFFAGFDVAEGLYGEGGS